MENHLQLTFVEDRTPRLRRAYCSNYIIFSFFSLSSCVSCLPYNKNLKLELFLQIEIENAAIGKVKGPGKCQRVTIVSFQIYNSLLADYISWCSLFLVLNPPFQRWFCGWPCWMRMIFS